MREPQQEPPPRAEYARTWRRYLRFFGPRGVADLDDELRFHIEMRVRDYMARGMSEQDARAATAQRLGDLAGARDTCVTIATRRQRRMTRAQILDALVQDVRFAGRTLRRQKGWTAVAVLTLALGIGANSAMFSVVNHLLLNPIPYPNADRVVVVFQVPSAGNNTGTNVMMIPMGRVVAAWRANSRSLEALETYITTDVALQRGGEAPRIAHSAAIQPSFAAFAGQRPLVGRMFTQREARSDAGAVLLSEGLWRAQYGADPQIVGKSITANGRLLTIVGVMPSEFQLPRNADGDIDLWLPLDLARHEDDGGFTVGRIRQGVSRTAAARELDDIARRLEGNGKKQARYSTKLASPAEFVSFHDSLILLSVAVALVLLIACANVAHLLLARASTRQRELAIRGALGAGTERLFRQLLTESLLLSIAGCIGGLLVGWVGLRLLVATRPESVTDLAAARIDGATLAVTIGLSLVTGLAFGVFGAVQASRHATHDVLKAGSLSTSTGRSHGRLRATLVVTEMALCTTLLVGAALLLRSVVHLQTIDPGFDARGLYSLNVQLPEERYASDASRKAFYDQLLARAQALPGVQGLIIAQTAPPWSYFQIGALQVDGDPDPAPGTTAFISANYVPPEFFRFMRLRLVQGTTFTDTSDAAGQVVVNESFARKKWPVQSALGHRLRIVYGGSGKWKTIVGVIADAFMRGPTSDASQPMLYMTTGTFRRPWLIVRTSGAATFIPTLTRMVWSIDSHLPPPEVSSVEEAMAKSIARPRFTMFLLMIFTVVAVGLAAIGLYGVLAYTVAQRTREIGIRMALGASRRTVARSVVSQGMVLAGVGAVIGLAGARAGTKLIGSMLYGVHQTDPVAFAAGGILLVVIAALACLVPARRALSVDPLIAMRAD
jgi:putative ABC transport system permease protein